MKAPDDGGASRLLGYVVPSDDDSSLFVTEHADHEVSQGQWQALRDTAGMPAPGPYPEALRTAWDVLNDVHAVATATAFRSFGLPHSPGEPFDPAALRGAGIAPRYERWLARAVGSLEQAGYLRRGPAGLEVARELPTAVPRSWRSGPGPCSRTSWRFPRTSATGCSPSPAIWRAC